MTKDKQIVWTPWRNQAELVEVKSSLYDVHSSYEEKNEDTRRRACNKISAWKARGSLPHAVESTWLLTEARLSDEVPNVPLFSIKAGYVTAISR